MSEAARVMAVRWLAAAMLLAACLAAGRAFATPPTFPPIPLIAGFDPPAWGGGLVIAAGFVLSAFARRSGCLVAACGLALLFLRDQHWLQPWAWQAFLLLLFDAAFPADHASRWQRRLAVSVYVFSAVSKLDAAFADHLGRLLVTKGLAPAVGLDTRFWGDGLVAAMAWSLPLGELMTGVLLVWRPRWGLAAATVMHAGLLLALGPLGLNHHPGVLVWNGFFVVHVWCLFANRFRPPPQAHRTLAVGLSGVSWIVLLLPILEPFGLWDHWPSWSVYSNRPAVVRLEVDGVPLIDDCDFVGRDNPLTTGQIVSLSGWSFESWRTPCYPQERFQLSVAAALIDRLPKGTSFVVRVLRYAGDRSGRADESVVDDRSELSALLDRYWLNTSAGDWAMPDEMRPWRDLPRPANAPSPAKMP